MPNPPAAPELSIIIPLLNEAQTLPSLLDDLQSQCGVAFEVLCCDGGSQDGTPEICRLAGQERPFPLRLLSTAPGRALQMNAGADVARAATLLFLHADSRFPDPLTLKHGLNVLRRHCDLAGNSRVAGHFQLSFAGPQVERPAYYFYTCKARSGRPGTVHGDQGLLLPAVWFRALGGFPTDLPLLEDTRLADRILGNGKLLLLPAPILTSSRRFEREGLAARQVLNALVMDFAAIGWPPFFDRARDLYRQQAAAGPLHLAPFLELIAELLRGLSPGERRRVLRATGAYVRSQGWQLGLALDCRRNFRGGYPAGEGTRVWQDRFDRWYDLLTDNVAGRLAAEVLVRAWFFITRHRLRRRQRREAPCPR